ncbi:MAG: UDP-N-acetylmuramate--L-alanine ligase [Patescibacteria group bacterium]
MSILDTKLEAINKIYFIGIGGSGVSAAARILQKEGKEVWGSDISGGEIVEELIGEGIKIFIGQKKENIVSDIDLVVYSVAVPQDNPERQTAEKLGLCQITYPQLLGLLMRDKYGIGVSGTNGKTTTTAMLAKIFLAAGEDPTVVVGSKVDFLAGNSRVGQGKYFIFESDEYRRAFDNYFPKIALVTYITADHLDYFKDLEEIKAAFGDYLNRLPRAGLAVINGDDDNSLAAAKNCQAKIVSFGLDRPANYLAQEIKTAGGKQTFEVRERGGEPEKITINLPAKYNIYNALGAIAVARICGLSWPVIKGALADFTGTWRRWQKIGKIGKTEIIVDYAHTPDAVEKTIAAAKGYYAGKKVLIVFQPHQYSRTKELFLPFSKSFWQADWAIITDIFYVKGREKPEDFAVSSQKLAEAIITNGSRAEYGGDLAQTEELIRNKAGDFDAVLMLGAGNIYEAAKRLSENN